MSSPKRSVCAKQIKNNKTFIDQSMYEILIMDYLKRNGDADRHRFLKLLDFFYINVAE